MIEALGVGETKTFSPMANDDSKMEIADLLPCEAPSLETDTFGCLGFESPVGWKDPNFRIYFETALSLASFQATPIPSSS